MSFSWGHTLIGTEPEGNPDFWHSALTTGLTITLLFISGVLIHSYHQWLTTQSHCSSVPWSCNAKWAFRNSAEPNGWDRRQMPAGRGVQSLPPTAHPIQKTWYFHLCDSCTASRPIPAAVEGKQHIPAPNSRAGSSPTQAWLDWIVHTTHTPSEWVDCLGGKMVAKWDWPVTWHICIPPGRGRWDFAISKATICQKMNNHTSISSRE